MQLIFTSSHRKRLLVVVIAFFTLLAIITVKLVCIMTAQAEDYGYRARAVQEARFGGVEGVHTNSMMNSAMLREYCRLDAASAALLERAMERLSLSARAYDRILKAARTIADLAGRADIVQTDIAEAINYRSLDRGNWGR